MKEFDEAVRTLELIIRFHPCAVAVLLGAFRPPQSAEDWDELKPARRNAERVKGGDQPDPMLDKVSRAELLNRTIARIGGWKRVNAAANLVRFKYGKAWEHFMGHINNVQGRCRDSVDGCTPLERTAMELHIHPNTLINHRYMIPRKIVRECIADSSLQGCFL